MLSTSAVPVTCAERDAWPARIQRLSASWLLILVALLECGMGAAIYAGMRSFSTLVFLLCTIALLVTAAVSMRIRSNRMLLAVQSSAAAALLALFWVSSNQAHGGLIITLGHSTYELTLTFAGLLFIALLLARLLRRSTVEKACKCG